MQQLTTSVESALSSRNWETALSLSLALPDIAGKTEYPDLGSRKRYALWFDKYVGHKYKARIGAEKSLHVFMSGDDCYALRCAYLHEGSSDISMQRARKALIDFSFSRPQGRAIVHCNQIDNKLQLQVDIFCQDIVDGVHQWIDEIAEPEKLQQMERFLKVEDSQTAMRVPPRPSSGYGFDPNTGIYTENK